MSSSEDRQPQVLDGIAKCDHASDGRCGPKSPASNCRPEPGDVPLFLHYLAQKAPLLFCERRIWIFVQILIGRPEWQSKASKQSRYIVALGLRQRSIETDHFLDVAEELRAGGGASSYLKRGDGWHCRDKIRRARDPIG